MPRPSCGVIAQVMWKRPNWSVVASRPRAVASRTSGDALLALVLQPVAVRVVEHLADDVGAVERGIRNDAHRGRGLARHCAARQRAHRLGAVHELAFAHTGADGEQQHQLVPPVGVTSRPVHASSRPAMIGSTRHAIQTRGAFDVAEARREAIDHGDVREVDRNRRSRP